MNTYLYSVFLNVMIAIQSFILIIKCNKSFITILRDDANGNLADSKQQSACFSVSSSDVFAVDLI